VSELHLKLQAIDAEIIDSERKANEHGAAARDLRKRRAELKQERSEIALAVNQAVSQQTSTNAANAATKAMQAAEASKKEADAASARLAEKEKELDELLAKVKASLAPPEVPPETPTT